MIKIVKSLFRGHMLLMILMVKNCWKKFVLAFYKKELQKINQEEFKFEKLIKSKCDKLYIKWKSYDGSFNSLIGQKDII